MHVVFFNVLGSGHVNPTLPVVRALVDRGDRVTYFTYPERRADVEAAGAVFHNYGDDDFRVARYHPDGSFPTQLFPSAAGLMPYLVDEVRRLRPDRIVTDSCAPWGAAVARVLEVPLLVSVTTFAFSKGVTASMRERGGAGIDEVNRRALDTLRDTWGVAFDEEDHPGFFGAVNVVYTGRAFNPPLDQRDERFVFVGPMITARPDTTGFSMEPFASSQRTRVYLSMGTIVGSHFGLDQAFYQPFFDALGDADRFDVIVSVGRSVDPAAFDAPDNVRIERFVPQLDLLHHVDVFITHGGMNSANEALSHGVPLVVVPFFFDQFVVADRVEACGAGVALDRASLDAATVRAAVERVVSDPAIRAGCDAVQADLRSGSGVQGVLDLV